MADPEEPAEEPARVPSDADPSAEAASTEPPPQTPAEVVAALRSKHRATLKAVFAKKVPANLRQRDVEALLVALGATIGPAGKGIVATIDGTSIYMHRPHPEPDMDKGAVVSVRKYLSGFGYTC